MNILTHTAEVSISVEQQLAIENLKRKRTSQDDRKKNGNIIECGNGIDGYKNESTLNEKGCRVDRGGALWDIFRREDVKSLEGYLLKHSQEFLCSVKKVACQQFTNRVFSVSLVLYFLIF